MTGRLEIEYEGARVKRLAIDGKDVAKHTTAVTLRLAVGEVPTATLDVMVLNGYVAIDECETEIVPHVVVSGRHGHGSAKSARGLVVY